MTNRRAGTTTWVNAHDAWPNTLTDGSRVIVDLLAQASDYQKHGATIVKVIGTIDITHVALSAVASEDFEDLLYLYVADETMDEADMPNMEVGADKASFLWTGYAAGRRIGNSGAGGVADPSMHLNFPLNVGAQRRLREEHQTLWLVIDNSSATGESLLWSCYIRTLLRTP